ncbi:MAG: tRNA (adenosine(37)-N6)-threonylcarbamoyltransferase complex transferase subunit TsaD [Candidatus Omnitrophica bacterium]|nr:tRNA (adenosine(37)-N6)-threonylcarbamoyltransferase complex transferase subunit TsaD [Candidatus Omnitrophota bacterium]
MYTLGIETSCDETSVSVVRRRKVLSCKTLSSLKLHAKYGGVIPEIASRRHLKFIDKVANQALKEAKININDIGLVAVTQGPGLIGSLLVGICYAKALAFSLKVPILGVNHLWAHLFASFLDKPLVMPFLGLVASGGHTQIYKVSDFDKITLVSKTLDDASGEALDKVGRFYGLGFPAAPQIDRISRRDLVDERLFSFKKTDNLNFSFSGIKTKAVYLHDKLKKQNKLSSKKVCQVLSSFQHSVVDSLINNLTICIKKFKIKSVVCGGGVLANRLLRGRLDKLRRESNLTVCIPEVSYCQDNAACVAGLGEYLYRKGYASKFNFAPLAR